jgi:TolA-binding protein
MGEYSNNGSGGWFKQNANLPNVLLLLTLIFTAGTSWNRMQSLETANEKLAAKVEAQSLQLVEAGKQQVILVWQVQALSEQVRKLTETVDRRR